MASEAAPATTRVTTRATTRARAAKKPKCVGHLSMLDTDALNLVHLAFLNAAPFSFKELIKRLATLREITKNWSVCYATSLYDKTAAVLYTSQMNRVEFESTHQMSRNEAINHACATSMDTMGYIMYRVSSPFLPPEMRWATLRLLGKFANATNAERLRLVGMGVGLPEGDVMDVVYTNFPANAQGAQAEEEEADEEDEENA